MGRVTLDRLDQKLDDMSENINRRFDELAPEVQKNTEFRIQSKATMGLIGAVGGFISGIILWIIGKLWR